MSKEYQQTIDWLFNQVPMFQNVGAAAYKPGLEGVLTLSAAFGNPHSGLETLHVGGTNGKGSVSSLLASVYAESGKKVGLFTSPHLVDFRERIRINGEMISEEAVVDFIKRYRAMNLEYKPSFFELTTVMAFEWFARCHVDIAVIEVGLGGRLDSTNVIRPFLSIITNISLDHTAQLGNTLEAIAFEKAGIIKHDIPVVIGNVKPQLRKVFQARANEVSAPIYFAQDKQMFTNMECIGSEFIYSTPRWGKVPCPLIGSYQPENANTAMTALEILRFADADAVKRGFKNVSKNTGLTGRWTILREHPLVICDTGHNPGGWEWLGRQLRDVAGKYQLHIVAGFVNDKDVKNILKEMPLNAKFYWATPSVKRGRDSQEVCAIASAFGFSGQSFHSVSEAFEAVLKEVHSDDAIFVGGSTYVVADLLTDFMVNFSK